MTNENILERFKNNFSYEKTDMLVQNLISELKHYNPLKVLYDLTIFYMSNGLNCNKVKRETLNSIIGYIQSIYAANSCYNSNKEHDIGSLIKNIETVIDSTRCSSEFDLLDDSLSNFSSHMYEISSGKTYPVLVPTILKNLLNTQDSLLKKVYNITHNDIISGLQKITESLAIVAELVSKKKDVPYERFDVKIVTDWPDSLINDLSWSIGNCSEYSTKEKYANWFNVEMPIKNKPFIKINGNSYFFDLNIVNDCFYRALQKSIHTKDLNFVDEWKQNQQKSSENFSLYLLSSIFKNSKVYSNNFYKDSNNKKVENDGLIIFNNMLFVVEVKGGSYTPRSVLTDPTSHTKAINNLIDNPLTQCERFIKTLENFSKIDVFDDKFKIKRCTINKYDFDYIIPISITLDPIGEIHTMHKDNSLKGYLSISIADLTIYSIFFDNEPVLFIHYLIQRIKEINIKNFMINDELDYLGSYLSNRNFNDRYKNLLDQEKHSGENIGSVWVDDMHEDIDKYFMSFMQYKKPKFDISNFIYKLIKKVEQKLNRDTLNAMLSILDQNDEFCYSFEKSVSHIISRQNRNNRFSTITVSTDQNNFIPIQLFANDIKYKYATDKKAKLYSLAIMETLDRSNLYYMIIDKKHDLIENVSVRLLNSNSINEVDIYELESIKSLISYEVKQKSSSIEKTKKIGRNDLCPCGSGKKYKKCCL